MKGHPEKNFALDDQLFSTVFEAILENYVTGRTPVLSPPFKAMFVVGQPAAGKTLLRNHLLSSLGIVNTTIVCNTDDIRSYHPSYDALLNDPKTLIRAPYMVNQDSGKLTESLFLYAINKYHILIDATFGSNDLQHYFRQFEHLIESKYEITFNLLAVHPKISYLSNYKRYVAGVVENRNERLVSKDVHDLSVKNLPKNILALNDFLNAKNTSVRSTIFYRDATSKTLQSNPISSVIDLSSVIKSEHSRPLTQSETKDYVSQVCELYKEMKELGLPGSILKLFEGDFREEINKGNKPLLKLKP